MAREIQNGFAIFAKEFHWSRPNTTLGFGAYPSDEPQEHPEDFIEAAVAAGAAEVAEPKKKESKAERLAREKAEADEAERLAREQAEADEAARLAAEQGQA